MWHNGTNYIDKAIRFEGRVLDVFKDESRPAALPAPRFSSSTGIRQHCTLQPSPATPLEGI